MLMLVRSSAEPLTPEQVSEIQYTVRAMFRNGKFSGVPFGTEACVAYSVYCDLLPRERFPFETHAFLERLGLDPSGWKLLVEEVV